MNTSRLLSKAIRLLYPELTTAESLKTTIFRVIPPQLIYKNMTQIEDIADFDFSKITKIETTHAGTLDNSPIAAIIETRNHPLLEWVITTTHSVTGLPIQLFHGPSLGRTIKENEALQSLINNNSLLPTEINTDTLDGPKYSALLLSKKFWDALAGRGKILIFQTDATLCPNSPYSLTDFIDFDYIGSWWPRDRPWGMLIDGGNGGLSIRDWKFSTACLEKFPPENWKGGEDRYFAFHIEYLNGRVARDIDMKRFGTQKIYRENSFGAHHITQLKESHPDDYRRFIAYCPEAEKLIR